MKNLSLHRNIEDRDMGLIWSIIFLNITVRPVMLCMSVQGNKFRIRLIFINNVDLLIHISFANFFVDHYEKPIYENGIQLTDMIYLKKNLDVVLDVKRVVDMAMHAGRILLKNGGEIFRVEETIKRICGRFHVNHVDIFSMSHGIFVSAENENGEAYTKSESCTTFFFPSGNCSRGQ